MPILKTLRGLTRQSKIQLAWDVFMVWVAIINLWLIVFDLSYLWMRPTYFQYLPVVTTIYDPVKGIQPNPLTSKTIEVFDSARELAARNPASPELIAAARELRVLTLQIYTENPFARSGQDALLGILKQELAVQTGFPRGSLDNSRNLEQAIEVLFPLDPVEFNASLQRRNPEVIEALDLCYHRTYDLSGDLTDHFWIVDLPFLVLFWIEFLARWRLALKRRTYDKWFFFPIFNWYDVLGLLPIGAFRPFRLLRAVSMYMRLRRSELSVVGQDVISRTVEYFSNIITEEVSDRVALRILGEFHEEIENGTHLQIANETIEPRRTQIQQALVSQIRQTLTNPRTLANLRALLEVNLEKAVDESESFRAVPLPNAIMKPLVRVTGDVILDTTLEAISATLDSAEGQRALEDLTSAMMDDFFYGPGLGQIESLTKDISLQVIEHMMDVVAIKKWTLPHPPGKENSEF